MPCHSTLLEAFKARKLILDVKVERFDADSVALSVFWFALSQ